MGTLTTSGGDRRTVVVQTKPMPMMTRRPIAPGDPRLEPIAGVGIEMYAQISKAAVTLRVHEAGLAALALTWGVDSVAAWDAAYEGWNARMQGDMQLATHFRSLYKAAA